MSRHTIPIYMQAVLNKITIKGPNRWIKLELLGIYLMVICNLFYYDNSETIGPFIFYAKTIILCCNRFHTGPYSFKVNITMGI